jgi:hypothetical protein
MSQRVIITVDFDEELPAEAVERFANKMFIYFTPDAQRVRVMFATDSVPQLPVPYSAAVMNPSYTVERIDGPA